jgi:hypothetical protein
MWAPWKGPGLEHLHLAVNDEFVSADGAIVMGRRSRAVRAGSIGSGE